METPNDIELDLPTPDYGYGVLLCRSFEDVLEGKGEAISPEGLFRTALHAGRVLLQARAGTGKSVTIARAAGAARSADIGVDILPAVVVASELATAASSGAALSVVDAIETTSPVLSSRADDVAVLFIDGLDEVESGTASAILQAVDQLAARSPRLGIVVADRLVRRSVTPTWQLATLSPVPGETAQEVLGHDKRWPTLVREVPLLLTLAAAAQTEGIAYADLVRSALPGLVDDELRDLASAVSESYTAHGNRLLRAEELADRAGPELIDRLVADHALRDTGVGDTTSFAHRLVADALAASAIADEPYRWNRDSFDALTFNASSFDALALVLSEIDQDAVDTLIRRVYDWNVYAAAYMLAEDRRGDSKVAAEMHVAILCMVAEKRFDRVIPTAQQAADALRLHGSPLAEQLLRLDLPGLQRVAADHPSEIEWFDRWRSLFVRPFGAVADEDDIETLTDTDGILGWTSSNVLRRSSLDDEQLAVVLDLASSHAHPTVRWRCTHVLGVNPLDRVADTLLGALANDGDRWVRYGALRSSLEAAAIASPAEREAMFSRLAAHAAAIVSRSELAREVERSLLIRDAPDDWAESSGLLLEALWGEANTYVDQDRWRATSARLRLAVASAL